MTENQKPIDNDKYNRMGVNPHELYMRQNGLCWLELLEYKVEGKMYLDGLYCTDGKDYSKTSCMLNPTFECMKCISKFTLEKVVDMKEDKKNGQNKMKLLMDILVSAQSTKKKNANTSFSMDLDTFLNIEKFLENSTMYSNATTPIKNNGTIKTLFGITVLIDNKVEKNTIVIKPSNKVFIIEV